MRKLSTRAMRREWSTESQKLLAVEAKVVEVRAIRTVNGRPARWAVTLESALGRGASATAMTPGSALRHARRKLGYRDGRGGRVLTLDSERAVQTRLP